MNGYAIFKREDFGEYEAGQPHLLAITMNAKSVLPEVRRQADLYVKKQLLSLPRHASIQIDEEGSRVTLQITDSWPSEVIFYADVAPVIP